MELIFQKFRKQLYLWIKPLNGLDTEEYNRKVMATVDALWIGSIPVFILLPAFFYLTAFTEGLGCILHALFYFIAIVSTLRFTGNLTLLAHVIGVSVFNTITLIAVFTGGIDSPVIILYSMMIPIVFDLAGVKIGLIWSGVYFVLLLIFAAVDVFIYPFPEHFVNSQNFHFVFIALLGVFIYHALYNHSWTNARELLQNDLFEKQQMLSQQDKLASLGQLTAGVAHEINNPLNFILGNTQTLVMSLADLTPLLESLSEDDPREEFSEIKDIVAQMREAVEGLERGSQRILGIVSGLKIFVHSGSGKTNPEDLHQLIDATLIILKHKTIDIETIRDYGYLPMVSCEGGKISQVILNVIDNAIDAMGKAGTLSIKTRKEGDTVEIIVRDTGPGIPSELMPQIFDPFFTTKKVGEGTGLGLSISYRIMQDHGGSITITPNKPKGTEVKLRLPLKSED